jgi:hypothetical protein
MRDPRGHREGIGLEVAHQDAGGKQLHARGVEHVPLEFPGDRHRVGTHAAAQLGPRLDREIPLDRDVALEAPCDADVPAAVDLPLDREVGADHRFGRVAWRRAPLGFARIRQVTRRIDILAWGRLRCDAGTLFPRGRLFLPECHGHISC